MHVKDRSQIAYLVVKDAVGGVYQPGDHFHSELLNIDQAKNYLDAGVIVELLPGDVPADVFKAATEPAPKPADDSPVKDIPFEPDTKPASPKAEKASK